MVETGIGRIPIVAPEDGRVVGILSRHDLLKARSMRRRAEHERATAPFLGGSGDARESG